MPFNPKALLDDGPVVLNVNLPDSQEEKTAEIAVHLGGKISKIKDAVVAKGRKKRNTFMEQIYQLPTTLTKRRNKKTKQQKERQRQMKPKPLHQQANWCQSLPQKGEKRPPPL